MNSYSSSLLSNEISIKDLVISDITPDELSPLESAFCLQIPAQIIHDK